LIPPGAWASISYCKLGLAGAGANWRSEWRALRSRLGDEHGPLWIAVAYADWTPASAPGPDAVLEAACESTRIGGVLVDTWDKTEPLSLDKGWIAWAQRVKRSGKLLAVAGGLGIDSISSLVPLAPDVVAVRGAACVDGNRRASIDPQRVAKLAQAVLALPVGPGTGQGGPFFDQDPTSNCTPCASGRSAP
jgi:uncharacterized protein (UPF0264 family)